MQAVHIAYRNGSLSTQAQHVVELQQNVAERNLLAEVYAHEPSVVC